MKHQNKSCLCGQTRKQSGKHVGIKIEVVLSSQAVMVTQKKTKKLRT